MRIGQIADRVAFYLRQSRSEYVDGSGNDMIIAALNTARRNAELQHDFVYQQKMAILSVDPQIGGLLSAAEEWNGEESTGELLRVKAVDTVYLGSGGTPEAWSAVYHSPKKALALAAKEDNYRYSYDYNNRYRPDYRAWATTDGFQTQAYFQGERLSVAPRLGEARNVLMDVQAWLPEYKRNAVIVMSGTVGETTFYIKLSYGAPPIGAQIFGASVVSVTHDFIGLSGPLPASITTPTLVPFTTLPGAVDDEFENYSDWFTDNAEEYLFWSAVVECNMYTRQFVPQANGFLAPPEKAAKKAYDALVAWDDFQWASGTQPGALNP